MNDSLIELTLPVSKNLALAILTKTSRKSFLERRFPGAPGKTTTFVSINFLSIVEVGILSSIIPTCLQKELKSVYPKYG